jgi:tRNA A-37 threonylcarbamoyl transferase component Bud32
MSVLTSRDLSEMKLFQLRDLARKRSLMGFSSMKKDSLIEELSKLKIEGGVEAKEEFKYLSLGQLGKKGKEGTVDLVIDVDTKQTYARKKFRSSKSPTTLRREAEFQQLAADVGATPKIIEVDYQKKWIIMEKLDRTLCDIIKDQNGNLTFDQQKQILNLYHTLDRIGVFHNDGNPLNIMEKNGRFYLIDFGFAKFSTHKSLKDRKQPNFDLMPLALLHWLKDKVPTKEWTLIREAVPEHIYQKLKMDEWP